jgi:hypothetical protein
VKFVIFFKKKMLCKVPVFFVHRLASTKVYLKEKKKVGFIISQKILLGNL